MAATTSSIITSNSSSDRLAKRSRRSRRFTPLTRQLCLQHHACGFGYKKISKATGIPISTIKYHVRKERGGAAGSCDDEDDADDDQESSAAEGVSLSTDIATEETATTTSATPSHTLGLERSVALVAMMHAVHDALKKNVYAFARALQHDSHGAPGIMRSADPHLLLLALELLLQDPWAERQELTALGQILLQRLYAAQDFLRSAISLCQRSLSVSSSVVAAASARAGLSACSSPAAKKTSSSDAKYWDCPVCAKRLVHTGKCAHQVRCLKKCKIVLTNEQLQAARVKAAAAVAQTGSPEELKLQLKQALAPPKGDDKCQGQVRYMQLVVTVNAVLQQDLEAAPEVILESSELWRTVQSGPNPVIPALTLVSLALQYGGGASTSSASESDVSTFRKKALVLQLSQELVAQVSASIDAVESFLAHCAEAAASFDDAHIHEHRHEQHTCTCHRVRISALIS